MELKANKSTESIKEESECTSSENIHKEERNVEMNDVEL
jgi:hypothetical protein